MGLYIEIPFSFTKLEEAVNNIICTILYYEGINNNLKIIVDKISRTESSYYELQLLAKLEYLKSNFKFDTFVINDYNEYNKRNEIRQKTMLELIDKIFTIFKNRQQNKEIKEHFISMLKSLTPFDIESLAANTELSDEEDYKCFLEAEKEWISLGKPKDEILVGLYDE